MTRTAMTGEALSGREIVLRITRGIGAAVGYGGLAAFLWLISVQLYRWFRDGEWTHIGVSDGLRAALARCCVDSTAIPAGLLRCGTGSMRPWIGWGCTKCSKSFRHRSRCSRCAIAGNSIFIYSCDRIEEFRRGR